jgi:predicted nucleic-acid-binding Zn-ribbon protein
VESGVLNSAEKEKVHEWFAGLRIEPQCPICGNKRLDPAAVIVPTKYDPEAALVFGGKEWPMIQVICDKCGYVLTFSARAILDLPEERTLDVRPA